MTAPERQPRPQRPTLHPLVWTMLAGVGLMLLLLVVGIYVLIGILQDSRNHIRAQDAKTAVLLKQVQTAKPAAHQASALVHDARPVVRQLHRSVGPLTESVTSVANATTVVPRIASIVQDVASVVLQGNQRLGPVLDATARLLAEVRQEDLVGVTARAGRSTPRLIRKLLRIQTATLVSQRLALRTQLTTLDILRQALVSIKSIDRKTGGTVPAQGAPVPAPVP